MYEYTTEPYEYHDGSSGSYRAKGGKSSVNEAMRYTAESGWRLVGVATCGNTLNLFWEREKK